MLTEKPAMREIRDESGFSVAEMIVIAAVIGVLSAIALPMVDNALAGFRLSGDARSVSNAIALAKMRAAANFTRARLYVDLGGETHRVEVWDKDTSTWSAEGGESLLSTGVDFGFDVVATPPPETQATIGQAPICKDQDGNDIAGTACITFNSRGIPIDDSLAPTALGALYVTDGSAVYGVTVAATGMSRLWHAFPAPDPSWVLN